MAYGQATDLQKLQRQLNDRTSGTHNTKTGNLPREIAMTGRRWFNRGPGNTYHSVLVSVTWDDGSTESYAKDFVYGYGSQYETTALELLAENGVVPNERAKYGGLATNWADLRDGHGVRIRNNVHDVKRRRDLAWNLEEYA